MKDDAEDVEMEREVRRRLEELEHLYGKVPFVAQALSERPDIFLAYSEFSDSVLNRPKHLDRKTAELVAIAAGSALASQHCLNLHLDAASKAGADNDEILEALLIGSFMSLTRSQSVALRMFQETCGDRKRKK